MIKRVWYDTTLSMVTLYTYHCMGLTTTCLTIGKYCTIITSHNRFDQSKSTFIVNLPLCWICSVYGIVCERSLVANYVYIALDYYLINSLINFNYILGAIVFFFRVHGPASDHDSNAFVTAVGLWLSRHLN